MHEFVLEGQLDGAPGIRALDIAKRLIDYGFHPPTIYFPLIVHEALMIEPTETETRETLDAFAEAMETIAAEARENPDLLHEAPHDTPVRRLDEVRRRAGATPPLVGLRGAGQGRAGAGHSIHETNDSPQGSRETLGTVLTLAFHQRLE